MVQEEGGGPLEERKERRGHQGPDQVLALDPKDLDVILVKASILKGARRQDEALSLYDAALMVDPKGFGANLGKAQMLEEKGDLDQSVEFYKEALRADVD